MASTKRVSSIFLVAIGLGILGLAGCSKTTYTYRCRDGFASVASSDAEALAGCGTHGGSLSTSPEISRSNPRSNSRSSGRSFFSSGRRSTSSSRRSSRSNRSRRR